MATIRAEMQLKMCRGGGGVEKERDNRGLEGWSGMGSGSGIGSEEDLEWD